MKKKILIAKETHTYKKSGFWDNKIIKKGKTTFYNGKQNQKKETRSFFQKKCKDILEYKKYFSSM